MSTLIEQYYQINFLRLFKLAKSIGAVSRKRKMPSNYSSSDDSKKACDRLFKTFLAKLFGGFEITSESARYSRFYIHISPELNDTMTLFRDEAIYLAEHHNDHTLLYDTLINNTESNWTAIQTNNIHRSYILINLLSVPEFNLHSHQIKDYFKTAKMCVDFKASWDNVIPQLITLSTVHGDTIRAASEHVREVECERVETQARLRREERTRRQAERRQLELEQQRIEQDRYEEELRLAQEIANRDNQILRERISVVEELRRTNNQTSFNDALTRWRENNNA